MRIVTFKDLICAIVYMFARLMCSFLTFAIADSFSDVYRHDHPFITLVWFGVFLVMWTKLLVHPWIRDALEIDKQLTEKDKGKK